MAGFIGTGYDRVMSDHSVAVMNDADSFGAHKLFPMVPSATKTGKYKLYNTQSFLLNDGVDLERAPMSKSKGGTITMADVSFSTKRYSWHQMVDLEDAASSAEVVREREDAVEACTQKLLIDREVKFQSEILNGASSVFTTKVDVDAVAGDEWDETTGDPIQQLLDNKEVIKGLTGKNANVAFLSGDAMAKLIANANVRARIGGATADRARSSLVTKEWLAVQLGVDEVVILDAVKSDGAGTITRIFTKIAGLVYRAPRPGRKSYGVGSMFSHDFAGMAGDGIHVPIKVFPREEEEAEKVEGSTSYQFKLQAADAGALLYDLW